MEKRGYSMTTMKRGNSDAYGETISEEPAQSPEESKTTEETTVDENNTIDSAGETIIETTNSETKEEAESVVETVTTEE